ncbi:protein-glutamine gamma-glutamyltransferase E [Aplochiton taeniatus]
MDLYRMKVDLHCKANNTTHHTNEITEGELIVRRGQSFLLTIDLQQPVNTAQDKLMIIAATGSEPSEKRGTKSVFSFPPGGLNGTLSIAQWKGELHSSSNLLAGNITLTVTPPANAPIGKYSLTVKTPTQEASLGNLTILFNPWCKDDRVYLPAEDEKKEYVMSEQGIIYKGSGIYINPTVWEYGQFEEDMVDICLKLLDVNPKNAKEPADDVSARCSPIYVSRVVSAMINSNDDSGVLVGKWGDYFGTGVNPSHWNGSVKILRSWYKNYCQPVKYGQCWVFAGTMCTVLRCLGIPCRVVTNFQSAHDTDGNLTIDEFISDYGVRPKESPDSVWNFHVWVEAWMKRPDLSTDSSFDGWQVVDPTPQEKSTGTYCCGPTPVKAILKGQTHLKYDGPFVFAEVNADRVTWMISANGSKRKLLSDTNSVGQNISTKAVGSSERVNITDNYKYKEGTAEEREIYNIAVSKTLLYPTNDLNDDKWTGGEIESPNDTATLAEQVRVEVVGLSQPISGQDISLQLVLSSDDLVTRSLAIRINAQAMRYTGTPSAEIQTELKEMKLQPKQGLKIPVVIPFSVYGKHMLENHSIKLSAVITDLERASLVCLMEKDIVLSSPELTITVLDKAQQFHNLVAEVVFSNPLSEDIKDCSVTVTGCGLLETSIEAVLPRLRPNHRVRIQVSMVPYKAGRRQLVANFDCSAFRDLKASCYVDVTPVFLSNNSLGPC